MANGVTRNAKVSQKRKEVDEKMRRQEAERRQAETRTQEKPQAVAPVATEIPVLEPVRTRPSSEDAIRDLFGATSHNIPTREEIINNSAIPMLEMSKTLQEQNVSRNEQRRAERDRRASMPITSESVNVPMNQSMAGYGSNVNSGTIDRRGTLSENGQEEVNRLSKRIESLQRTPMTGDAAIDEVTQSNNQSEIADLQRQIDSIYETDNSERSANVDRYLDSNRKLSKYEKNEANAIFEEYLNNNPKAKELYNTNDAAMSSLLAQRFTPDEAEEYAKMITLKNKISRGQSAGLHATESMPFVKGLADKSTERYGERIGRDLSDYDYSSQLEQTQTQNPLASTAGNMAYQLGSYAAFAPLLEGIPVVGKAAEKVGGLFKNPAVGEVAANIVRGQAADTILDTLPNEVLPDIMEGNWRDLPKDILLNQAGNLAFNVLGEGAGALANRLIPSLRNADEVADAVKQNEIDPKTLAKQNEIDVNAKVDNVNQAVDDIYDLAEQIPETPNEIVTPPGVNAGDEVAEALENTGKSVGENAGVITNNDVIPPSNGNIISGGDGSAPNGDKLSKLATNTIPYGTNLTPEEYARLDLSQFKYDSKTEQKSMEDAFRMIQEEGVDNLKARLLSEDAKDLTQSEIDALMSLTRTNNATARALEVEGKIDEAMAIRAETTAIYKKLRQQSTSNAQGLQALAKWTRNTPEGMLMHAENVISGNTKVEKSALQEALDKLKRSKKDIDFSPEFEAKFLAEAEKLQAIGDMDSREAKDIMARLGRMINDEIPVKLNEKVQAYLMDNMLGNFRTLITRNAGGNVGLNAMEQALTRPLAAGIDRLIAKKTGKRTQVGMTREALSEYISGFRKGLSDEAHDLKTGLHTARTGENTIDEAIRANRHVFKGKVMDKLDSLVKNGLSVGDRPFYEATYKQTLGDYYRLRNAGVMGVDIQSLSDEAFDQYAKTAANLNALSAVYQNDSMMSNALLKLKDGIGDLSEGMVGFDILSQFSMPFVKTPANVVDRAIDYSPLGAVRNAVRTIKEGGIKGENFDQNRFVNETARNIIGTGLMGGATGLAANGVLSGAYSDDKDKAKAQKESGMQEYALNLPGNLQMDIGWIPVLGSNAVAADAAYNAYKDNKESKGLALKKGLTEGGQALFDQSMFQGLQRLFGTGESYNSDEGIVDNMLNVVKQGFGQAIPSLLRQTAQVTDKYQRDLGNSNKDTSLGIMDNYDLNSLANNIPVLRELVLNPKVNAQGELVEESQGRGFGARVLEDMFLPGKITQLQDNRLSEEAQRISDVTGNAKAYMPRASRTKVDTEDHTLSNKEWLDYQQKYGKEMTAAGNMVMDSDAYRAADDATKEKMLDDIYSTVASAINSDYNGKDIDKAAQKYKEEGLEGLQEYLDAKYNPYGLDKDTYTKLKDAGEDLSVYEGYGDALEEYGLNDNADNREYWKQAGVDGLQAIAYYNQSFIDAGMDKAYTSKSAYQAFNDGKLEEYKEYRDYLKANGLQDSEKRWNEYQQSGIPTSSSGQGFRQEVATTDQSSQQSEVSVDPITQIQNSGVKINALDSAWAKASNANPGITPEDFINTWSAIDANNNGNFTKDEWVNFLNASGLDPQAAEPYFDMYYNNNWNRLKYSNGSWKK